MKFANVWFDTMAATFLDYYVISNVVGGKEYGSV